LAKIDLVDVEIIGLTEIVKIYNKNIETYQQTISPPMASQQPGGLINSPDTSNEILRCERYEIDTVYTSGSRGTARRGMSVHKTLATAALVHYCAAFKRLAAVVNDLVRHSVSCQKHSAQLPFGAVLVP